MAIVSIQKLQFVSRDKIDDVIRSISLNEREKHGFSFIWSMFLTIFRYSTTKTGKYVKELSLSFPNLKTELKSVEIVYVLFRLHCIISVSIQDFELKLGTRTKFDTLISNLKLDFQYDIVMTS